MKILIASDYYPPFVGGVISHIETITREFLKMGDKVCVIAPSTSLKNGVQRRGNFTLYEIPSLPSLFVSDLRFAGPFNSRKIAKAIRDFSPDVIHIHSSLAIGKTVSKLARKFDIPVLGTNHFMSENFFDNIPVPLVVKRLFDGIVWRFVTTHLRLADVVTVPTATGANYLNTKAPNINAVPMSNGINFEKYNNFRGNSKILTKLGISKKDRIMLFVGRLVKEKKLEVLFESLPGIVKNAPTTLVVVGRGNFLVNYKKMADDLDIGKNIVFTGYLSESELIALYHASDVFVMPSLAELQSIATLEAMACGLPVIAADASALPEIVRNGKNGYLFKPNDPKSLTKSVIKIFVDDSKLRKMGRASVDIAKKHDISEVAIQFKDLYQKAASVNLLARQNASLRFFYPSRVFVTKIALVVFVLAVMFRNALTSPSIARARGVLMNSKIMNSEIVKKIENLDLKLKTTNFREVISK